MHIKNGQIKKQRKFVLPPSPDPVPAVVPGRELEPDPDPGPDPGPDTVEEEEEEEVASCLRFLGSMILAEVTAVAVGVADTATAVAADTATGTTAGYKRRQDGR